MLGHRFEQGALHLGGCPVDLIGKQQVVKQRTGLEDEAAILGAIDVGPRQVGRKQIGSELDAVKPPLDAVGQHLDGAGLGQTGWSFHQNMAIGEQCRHQAIDQLGLSQHLLIEVSPYCIYCLSRHINALVHP